MKVRAVLPLGRDAQDVAAHFLGLKRLDLYQVQEKEVPDALINRLLTGEPSAYIIGHVDFFGAHIKVDGRCLIPRQETEQLVAKIGEPRGRLLDLCCGSGAIGISLKKKYPQLEVVLADISEEALSVAKENAQANDVDVTFVKSHFLDSIEGTFDIIICNPPYVTEEEWQKIATKDFEPRIAFIGGLEFYKILAARAASYMKSGGLLALEIGSTQGEAVSALFQKQSYSLEKDFAGLDRFLWIFY